MYSGMALLAAIPATDPISPQGRDISNLFVASLVLSGIVFLLVIGLLTGILVRAHRRRAEPPSENSGNRRLEIAWTALPFLLLAGLFVFTVRTMNHVGSAETAGDADPLEISVIG